MKKISKILVVAIVAFTFSNCSDDTTDVAQETSEIQSKNGEEFTRINEIISSREEILIYEIPSEYVEENSHYLEAKFTSVEKIDVVRYNDVHLFKVSGQNYEAVDTIEYYVLDELVDAGGELSSGGNGGNYCTDCTSGNRVRIDYFIIRPDGSHYLDRSECLPCPPGLQSAVHAASGDINTSND